MLVPRPYLRFAARYVSRQLAKGACEVKDVKGLEEAFDKILLDDLSIEDEINDEARELLHQYDEYMRQNEIPFHEMFNRVKRNLLEERKYISAAAREPAGERKMKLSRDKLNDLSHKLAAQLPRIQGVRVLKGWNDVRLEIGRELGKALVLEEQVDNKARQMIEKQQRRILEGSEEWNVLHRRYYEQEMGKMGVDLSMPQTPQV